MVYKQRMMSVQALTMDAAGTHIACYMRLGIKEDRA